MQLTERFPVNPQDHLKDEFWCRWCHFPDVLKDITDITQEIEHIERALLRITKEWEKVILKEIERNQANMSYLGRSQRLLIERLTGNVPGDNQDVGHARETEEGFGVLLPNESPL